MIYGDWELTEDCYYYKSQNIIVFPTSNSVDRGKLTVEENMREIVTRITNLNYALSKDDFKLIINRNPEEVPDTITVNPGKANLLGYCVYTNAQINLPLPKDLDGDWYTIGMSLAMDGSDHVCGDVLNKDGSSSSDNEMYSGAYLRFYKDCEIKNCWKRILILGRVKIKNDKVIEPKDDDCEDPFKDHRIDGDEVDMRIIGKPLRNLDTYDVNITNVEDYETALHDIASNTKPPTFTTDVQEYSEFIPDWYVSKYGDYMTGALTMRHYSDDYEKQFPTNKINDNVIISPRGLGKLTSRENTNDVTSEVGGTIMTVVPNSYAAGIDSNSGSIGTHAALLSSSSGDTGLDIHALDMSRSRLVHDIGRGNLLIENLAGTADENGGTLSHIRFDHGQMFAYSDGNGIQLYSRDSSGNVNNIDMRVDQYKVTISENDTMDYHGQHDADKVHHTLGLGITNGIDTGLGYVHNTDAYYLMDNLRLRSNTWSGRSTKLNTIESVDPGDLKYIRVLPRTMTGQVLAEERLQVGVGKANDVVGDEANRCNNRISIVSNLSAGATQSTYIEQMVKGQVYNRIDHDSSKVDGIYSYKNIGSSSDRSNGNPWNNNSNYVKIDNTSIILHGIGDQTDASSKSKISFGCGKDNSDVTIEHFYDHSRDDYNDTSHGYLKLTGGLDITGDVNYWGDSTNWGRVFNAVYNDYAEWYKKSDDSETFEAGDVISLQEDGKYSKSRKREDTLVVGVCSDTYGHITGGDKLVNMSDNEKTYIPVGISGRVRVKCVTVDVKPGDLLVSSDIEGTAMVNNDAKPGTIIGKALSNNNDGYVMMQIMLS